MISSDPQLLTMAHEEAERFLGELRERFAKFGLALHPEKTRLIEFGRYADRDRRERRNMSTRMRQWVS